MRSSNRFQIIYNYFQHTKTKKKHQRKYLFLYSTPGNKNWNFLKKVKKKRKKQNIECDKRTHISVNRWRFFPDFESIYPHVCVRCEKRKKDKKKDWLTICDATETLKVANSERERERRMLNTRMPYVRKIDCARNVAKDAWIDV